MNSAKNMLCLSADNVAILVAQHGVANCIAGIADYIVADFKRWQEFEKCARLANHSPQGVIELMPIADQQFYAFKYVNGHPKNEQLGLPTIMAFGAFCEMATGVPLLVCDLTLVTALRTAATSAMVAKLLARPDATRMALIGNGAQSEFQALAFHHMLGVQEFRLFDVDSNATDKLLRNLASLGLQGRRCSSVATAVQGVDIITTVTADKTNATILLPEFITPSMHLNAVGGDCPGKTELHADILDMGTVFVEFTPQSRIEGEVQQKPQDFPVVELWEVLQGQHPGRTSPEDVTIFDSVGFALEDFSALRYIFDLATQLGIVGSPALVPILPEPKNLFSLIPPSAVLAMAS
jgi:ornithine cyclodeaminase